MKTETNKERFSFEEPTSIREAWKRKRELQFDIMSIDRQLGDPCRRDRKGKPLDRQAYLNWRKGATAVKMTKVAEHAYLIDWIKERRRLIEANKLGIWNPDDPKELLMLMRKVMALLLDGESVEEAGVGGMYNIIDTYLRHAA